jgi:riboflavin biosynthesis pyrimidine reductase
VDRIVFYIAPVLLGGDVASIGGIGKMNISLANPSFKKIGPDLRIEAEVLPVS